MEKGVSPFSSLSESFPTATVKLGSLPGTAQDDEQGQNLPLPLPFHESRGKNVTGPNRNCWICSYFLCVQNTTRYVGEGLGARFR